MRTSCHILAWLAGSTLLLLLGYETYVEIGGPAEETIARARACMLCHALPTEPLACLHNQPQNAPIAPLLAARLRQAHPLLSRGAEEPLADLLARAQLPELERRSLRSLGEALYVAKCAACHGRNGAGQPGEYPPLLGSEWLTDEPSRLPEILTHGLHEPIKVKGEAWDKTMRAPGLASPEEVQKVIDYLRTSFARQPMK